MSQQHKLDKWQHALQGDLRFVMTVKGSRILLSVASAAEELKPVIAKASDFDLLSFKVLWHHYKDA